jgi:hypothetical protein
MKIICGINEKGPIDGPYILLFLLKYKCYIVILFILS